MAERRSTRRWISRVAWRAAVAALLPVAVACLTPRLPDAEPASIIASQTMRQVQALFLWPEKIDRRMLIGALEALEARYDPVRFEAGPAGDGTLYVGQERASVPLETHPDPRTFREVLGRALAFVRLHTPDELIEEDDEELELLALRGALHALDRYATIFSGRGTEDFRIRFSGKLHGIGARIGRRDGDLVAARVFPESPAERGGLQDGDAILAVDGESTQPLTVAEAVGMIRGTSGTKVVLTVRREDQKLDLGIIRGEVVIPSVETEQLEAGIGYARIVQVSRTTRDEFQSKVEALGPLEGLVLDLRGNSGGSMLAAAGIADFFMAGDTIVSVIARDGGTAGLQSRAVADDEVQFDFPIVVLVDENTASAAEILAGAISPLERVTVVGQTTFGKGLIQRVLPLTRADVLIKLTVAEYRLSGDRVIQEKGVEPDVRLYPVSTERLGPLGEVPAESIPYLRAPGDADRFPIELASRMLREGNETALAELRDESRETIRKQLDAFGVAWVPQVELPDEMSQPLEIALQAPPLSPGETGVIWLKVRNPNAYPIQNAWAVLDGSAGFLANKVIPLGTIPARGEAGASFDLTPPEGLSGEALPVKVHVASGSRPLDSELVSLRGGSRVPLIAIEVTRKADDRVEVTLINEGDRGAGTLRVDVPGAFRVIEALAADARETVELPLSGDVKAVRVSLLGPLVTRRVEVPLPDEFIAVRPPSLWVEPETLLGRSALRFDAESVDGLLEGWIVVDGEKQTYVHWGGDTGGSLRVPLEGGDHRVSTKIETLSGVAVIDTRGVVDDPTAD